MTNTTTNRKPTHKELFTRMLSFPEVANDSELVEFINSRIAQLDKKTDTVSPSKKAHIEANEHIKAVILETIADNAMTVSEMMKSNSELAELSGPKITALVKQLLGTKVERTEIKGKAYFKAI